jgi:hypothetical protein
MGLDLGRLSSIQNHIEPENYSPNGSVATHNGIPESRNLALGLDYMVITNPGFCEA